MFPPESWVLRALSLVSPRRTSADQGSAFAPGSLPDSPGPHGPPPPHMHILSQLSVLGTPMAGCTPSSGQLWCIVVALHVLAVPMQCFHSASQRPAQPSRDFQPGLVRGLYSRCWVTRQGRPGEGREACTQLKVKHHLFAAGSVVSLQKGRQEVCPGGSGSEPLTRVWSGTSG